MSKFIISLAIMTFTNAAHSKETGGSLPSISPSSVHQAFFGSGTHGSTSSLPSNLTEEQKFGCKIAAAARLEHAVARNNCDAAVTIEGGAQPPVDDVCGAPSTASGKPAADSTGQSDYSQSAPRCVINGSEIDPTPNKQTDCSGFTSGVLARVGARLQPGKDIKEPFATATLKDVLLGKDSCWKEVKDEKAWPGDMCFFNNGVGHVWLIGRVSQGGEFTRMESTTSKTTSGIQETSSKGAKSDAKGAGACDREAGKTSEGVHHMRIDSSKPECVNNASQMKFKGEQGLNCSVGPIS